MKENSRPSCDLGVPRRCLHAINATRLHERRRWVVRTASSDRDAPRRLIEEVGAKGQWRVIADRLRSGRSPGAVEQHWQIMTGGRKGSSATRLAQQAAQSMEDGDDLKRSRATKTRAVAHRWTPQEEAQLSALVEELGPRLCGNQPVRRVLFIKSFLGDEAAVPAPSSGDELAPPRHRAGVASMAWRTTR